MKVRGRKKEIARRRQKKPRVCASRTAILSINLHPCRRWDKTYVMCNSQHWIWNTDLLHVSRPRHSAGWVRTRTRSASPVRSAMERASGMLLSLLLLLTAISAGFAGEVIKKSADREAGGSSMCPQKPAIAISIQFLSSQYICLSSILIFFLPSTFKYFKSRFQPKMFTGPTLAFSCMLYVVPISTFCM
jgi:hypothetical protein